MADGVDIMMDALACVKVGTMGRPDPCAPDRVILYDPLSDCCLEGARVIPAMPRPTVLSLATARTSAALTESALDAGQRYYFLDGSRAKAWNVELTDRCTWSCRHCYQSTTKCEAWQQHPGVHDSAWPRLAEVVRAYGPTEISLSGGELLLFDALPQLLAGLRAGDNPVAARVLLTGMALWRRRSFRELLPLLAEHRVVAKVPIYSRLHETNDWVTRCAGSLDDTLRLIESLRAAGVEVFATLLILDQTVDQAVANTGFLRGLMGDAFGISTLVYPSRGKATHRQNLSHLLAPGQIGRLLQEPEFAALPVEYLSFQPQCASGCRFSTVLPDGTVLGCAVCRESAFGNVYADPASLARMASWPPSDHNGLPGAACQQCFASIVCKRCWAFSHDARAVESYCRLVRVCARMVVERIRKAVADGLSFLHPQAHRRWEETRALNASHPSDGSAGEVEP